MLYNQYFGFLVLELNSIDQFIDDTEIIHRDRTFHVARHNFFLSSWLSVIFVIFINHSDYPKSLDKIN